VKFGVVERACFNTSPIAEGDQGEYGHPAGVAATEVLKRSGVARFLVDYSFTYGG